MFYGHNQHGFSRVDALFCGLIFLCLLVWVTPVVHGWRQHQKTSEVLRVTQAIFDAQMVYFNDSKNFATSDQATENRPAHGRNAFSSARNDPRTFLALPPTPKNIESYAQQAAFLEHPWSELNLKIDSSVQYQYQVTTNGLTGTEAAFEIIVFGNRDGDETVSQWRMRGFLNFNGKPMGREALYRLDPFE